jgi:ribonuclease P protein component
MVSWLPAVTPNPPVLAFAISKKVGSAVVRNRLRRRLKEAARRDLDLPSGIYLVRAAPAAAALNFAALSQHLGQAIRGLARLAPPAAIPSPPPPSTPTHPERAVVTGSPC